jgi:hypothetical protein
MKQSEVCGVPSENSKTNNIRGKWTGFGIKESIVNIDCFQLVAVMFVSLIVAPSSAAVSHGKSSSAGTSSDICHGQETPCSVPAERIHQNDASCCK